MASGFSWINRYGSSLGAAFPPGNDYPAFQRAGDVYNVNTENTILEMALALPALAALSGCASVEGQALIPGAWGGGVGAVMDACTCYRSRTNHFSLLPPSADAGPAAPCPRSRS